MNTNFFQYFSLSSTPFYSLSFSICLYPISVIPIGFQTIDPILFKANSLLQPSYNVQLRWKAGLIKCLNSRVIYAVIVCRTHKGKKNYLSQEYMSQMPCNFFFIYQDNPKRGLCRLTYSIQSHPHLKSHPFQWQVTMNQIWTAQGLTVKGDAMFWYCMGFHQITVNAIVTFHASFFVFFSVHAHAAKFFLISCQVTKPYKG